MQTRQFDSPIASQIIREIDDVRAYRRQLINTKLASVNDAFDQACELLRAGQNENVDLRRLAEKLDLLARAINLLDVVDANFTRALLRERRMQRTDAQHLRFTAKNTLLEVYNLIAKAGI